MVRGDDERRFVFFSLLLFSSLSLFSLLSLSLLSSLFSSSLINPSDRSAFRVRRAQKTGSVKGKKRRRRRQLFIVPSRSMPLLYLEKVSEIRRAERPRRSLSGSRRRASADSGADRDVRREQGARGRVVGPGHGFFVVVVLRWKKTGDEDKNDRLDLQPTSRAKKYKKNYNFFQRRGGAGAGTTPSSDRIL